MSQQAGIVWAGAWGRITNEAWQHPGKLAPAVNTACDAAQWDCAMGNQGWMLGFGLILGSVLFPSHGFPIATFLFIVPILPYLPSDSFLAFPHLYSVSRELTLSGCVSKAPGPAGFSSASGKQRWETGGGRKEKEGYLYPFLSVSSGFNSHQGPNFCIPKSSNTTASLCPLSTQGATISCCCLVLHCLSVHSETSLLSQHLHNQLPRIKFHCGKY